MKNIVIFLLLVWAVYSSNAIAAEPYTKLSMSLISWHHDRSKNYNETNQGFIAQHNFGNKHNVIAAVIKNSFARTVPILGYGYTVYEKGDFSVMPWVGLTNDYVKADANITVTGAIRVNYKWVNIETIPGVVYGISVDLIRW